MDTLWIFDSAVLKETNNAVTVPGPLRKDPGNPLFTDGALSVPAVPWELLLGNGYPNVFFDPLYGKYRAYYTSYLPQENDKKITQTYKAEEKKITGILYAESEDGIHWIKPALGAVSYYGNTENNIIALNTHGAGFLFDPDEPDARKRYKIISRNDCEPLNIHAAFSEDGIHFHSWQTVIDDPRFPGDTHNFVLRDRDSGKYRLYTRTFVREIRTEVCLSSDDFIHWSDPLIALIGLNADDQVYGMTVFQQDGLYWGLAEIFHFGDKTEQHYDHVEIELCYSGDGIRFQRVSPFHPFIPNGSASDFDFGTCYASAPVSDGDDLRFYYIAGNGTHYHLKQTGLCLGRIKRNRLAGITGRSDDEFTVQTCKIGIGPKELTMCVDVRGGMITYEALDENGEVMQGMSKDESVPITASCDHARLCWRSGKRPEGLCMLRFYCEKAVLYSLNGDLALHPAHPL